MPHSAPADSVLSARRLTKTVGRRRLVDDVSFDVRRGEAYVLVGAYGSGKSAVARMLVGLVRPTTGEAHVLGRPVGPDSFAMFERVGWASDDPVARRGLTVRQNLELSQRLAGNEDSDAVNRTLARVGLEGLADERVSRIGDDERRLVGVARAVVRQPEVLVLDEPTRGLGRAERRLVFELLRELVVERGVTLLACVHAAEGLPETAMRVGLMSGGRLVDEFDRKALRERGRTHVEIVVSDPARAALVLEERLGCTDYAVCEDRLIRVYVGAEMAGDINAALLAEGVAVTRLAINEGSLEDLLIKLASEGRRPL